MSSVVAVQPGPRQPSHAANMKVGDSWEQSFDRLQVWYDRISSQESTNLLANGFKDTWSMQMYGYDGSGMSCPRCGRSFVLLLKQDWADDMRADQDGTWICEDSECGMRKREKYNGYGTIFLSPEK